MFYVCSASYRSSGRLSRTWIVEGDQSPDTPTPCDPDCMIYGQGGSGSCGAGGCIPYPFNGMGGNVEKELPSLEAAQGHERWLWLQE